MNMELGRGIALFNNAGHLATQWEVEDMVAARIACVFATTVIGSILCSREAVHRMSNRRRGPGWSIVNVSKVAARVGSPGEYLGGRPLSFDPVAFRRIVQ